MEGRLDKINQLIIHFFLTFEEEDEYICEDHYLEQERSQISKRVN